MFRLSERVRALLLTVTLTVGLGVFLATVDHHYAVRSWLVWRYAWYWLLSIVWGVSCLAAGLFLLEKVRPASPPSGDTYALAFPLGVFAFFVAIFVVGLAGLLGSVTFVLLPIAGLALGWRRLPAAWARLRAATDRIEGRDLPFILFGLGGLVLVYVQILSPEAFNYDARWYHVTIAENYAHQGAVRGSPEGWWMLAYPHLASFVYTWAFLLPKSLVFDRLELCIHLEFVVFAATVASVPVLVRRLVPDATGRLTWSAFFLFPAIFLYDGNLNCAADHFAALWAIPLLLALDEAWRDWNVRTTALFSVFVAGLMMTKYSAWAALPLPIAAVGARGLWLLARGDRGRVSRRTVLLGAGALCGGVLVLTAPHWLTNWIWYGDPLYPMLRKFLHAHPWNPDADGSLAAHLSNMRKAEPGWRGLLEALRTTVTFSFVPNDYFVFHRDVPIFGSLFTLFMFGLPFVRANARLWACYAMTLVSIFAWFLLSHYDRYLQLVLPWMAACTAAMVILLWRSRSLWVRLATAALVVAQVAWGSDVPFIPSHNLLGATPLQTSLSLASSGFRQVPNRLRTYGPYGEIGDYLPSDANVLIHEEPLHLGIDARSVQDQWQGRIAYARLQSPAAIYGELASLGVTHLLWSPASSYGWNCLGHDLAFWSFAENHTVDRHSFGGFAVATMPAAPPAETFNDKVAVMTCGGPYPSGWYRLRDLTVPAGGGQTRKPEAPLPPIGNVVEQAGFLVVEPGCSPPLPEAVGKSFGPPKARGALRLYVRRAGASR